MSRRSWFSQLTSATEDNGSSKPLPSHLEGEIQFLSPIWLEDIKPYINLCPQYFPTQTVVLIQLHKHIVSNNLRWVNLKNAWRLSSWLRFFRLLLLFPLLRGNSLGDRKCMYFFHLLCQCSIHHSMPLQQPLPCKLLWYNLHCKACTAPDNSMKLGSSERKWEEWSLQTKCSYSRGCAWIMESWSYLWSERKWKGEGNMGWNDMVNNRYKDK